MLKGHSCNVTRHSWVADWSAVPAPDYLRPFLAVIQSGETGGQITAVALSAVARILNDYIIGTHSAAACMAYKQFLSTPGRVPISCISGISSSDCSSPVGMSIHKLAGKLLVGNCQPQACAGLLQSARAETVFLTGLLGCA